MLRYLAEVIGEKPPDDIVYACSVLDKYYIPTRYPSAWVGGAPEDFFTSREAEEAIKLAKKVINWIR